MKEKRTDSRRQVLDDVLTNVKRMALICNAGLLFVHCLFILLFYQLGAWVMFIYNFVSVAVYILCFPIIIKSRSSYYAMIIYAEISVFMIIGTISLGWDFGFIQYSYAFVVSTMFTDFFLGAREKMRIRTYVIVTFVAVCYIALRIWTWHKPYLYPVRYDGIKKAFFIINGTLTMAFIVVFIILYAVTAYRMQRELNRRATVDILTGLMNRSSMQPMLLSRVDGYDSDHPMAIAIFDIDFFKSVNDSYGHDAGDIVLKSFADILKNISSGELDVISSRWGGEEFLLLFTCRETGIKNRFEALAEEICENIRVETEHSPIRYMDTDIAITVTAGLTIMHEGMTEKMLFKEADEKLYYGKEHGRNQVVHRRTR